MRKTKKTLAMLLALAMVLTLFAGVAQASAQVSIGGSVATVLPAADRTLGRLDIASAAQQAVAAGDVTVVTVTLPTGITWTSGITSTVTTTAPNVATTTPVRVDGQVLRVTFENSGPTSTPSIRITALSADVASTFRGDVNATVVVRAQTSAGDFIWEQTATVRLATVVAAGTTVTGRDATNVIRGAAVQNAGSIRIEETIAGSFATGTAITLTPPAGVTFVNATAATTLPGGNFAYATSTSRITVTTTDTPSVTPGRIDISGIVLNVDQTVADGPINITVRGTNVDGTATIATVGVVGVVTPSSVTAAADLATLNAGRLAEAVSDIRLTENLPNAFLGHRVLTLALPAGFSWNTSTTPSWAVSAPAVSADGRTLTFWTVSDPTGTGTGANQFDLTGITINTHITAPAGDIVVTVGGNTGASGTVTVAKLRRPVTVVASTTPNVRADSHNQAIGNLVITEAFQGALGAGATAGATTTLTITLPAGTTIVGTPSETVADVTGTEPEVAIEASGSVITLTVTAPATAATNPTTVTVSGIRVSLDRVPVGSAITATVAGTSILETGSVGIAGTAPANLTEGTARGTVVAEVALANVISRTARTTVFTIDATAFTVDGVAQPALEVAPFVDPASNRTLVPLRAVANAAGVLDRNIAFVEDKIAQTQKVILVRGDRVVQFTIGETSMVVNGVVLPIDQAPMIINGRTVLPVRALEMALGVALEWDGAARTVTVKLD